MREISRSRRLSRQKSAFTLIEVLLVLIILVILGSLAASVFTGTQDKANIQAATIQIGLVEEPISRYRLAMNKYPEELSELWEEPEDDDEKEKWGTSAYMKEIPDDPWGNPYEYLAEGEKNPDGYDIWSLGPDGEDGTEDDIGNWDDDEDDGGE